MPPVMPSASTSSYGKSNGGIRDLRAAQLNGRALTLFGTLCSSSDADFLCVEICFTANDTDRIRAASLDHLVGAGEQRRRQGQAERLRYRNFKCSGFDTSRKSLLSVL